LLSRAVLEIRRQKFPEFLLVALAPSVEISAASQSMVLTGAYRPEEVQIVLVVDVGPGRNLYRAMDHLFTATATKADLMVLRGANRCSEEELAAVKHDALAANPDLVVLEAPAEMSSSHRAVAALVSELLRR
jgi:hypothetical protein